MKAFVVIYDEPHKILASLTSSTPLVPCHNDQVCDVKYDVSGLPERLPDEYFFINCDAESDNTCFLDLPIAYKAHIARKWDFVDITKIDQRCEGTERLKKSTRPSMLSCDLLNFGLGALRRKWDNPDDCEHQLMRKRWGQIVAREMTINEMPSKYSKEPFEGPRILPETWQSTNLIYGDCYGELTQILRRHSDSALLQGILKALGQIVSNHLPDFYSSNFSVPPEIINGHFAHGKKWDSAPRTETELIERVEFILSNSFVEEFPGTVYQPSKDSDGAGRHRTPSEDDEPVEGYDGWLQNPYRHEEADE